MTQRRRMVLARALLKVKIRKATAEAALLETKVEQQSIGGEQMFPASQVKKAWIANELSWVEQLRTIGRQLGGVFGGILGKQIEHEAQKLFDEMFNRMANDPILSGKGGGGQSV